MFFALYHVIQGHCYVLGDSGSNTISDNFCLQHYSTGVIRGLNAQQ